jgi:hypothetical protein
MSHDVVAIFPCYYRGISVGGKKKKKAREARQVAEERKEKKKFSASELGGQHQGSLSL